MNCPADVVGTVADSEKVAVCLGSDMVAAGV